MGKNHIICTFRKKRLANKKPELNPWGRFFVHNEHTSFRSSFPGWAMPLCFWNMRWSSATNCAWTSFTSNHEVRKPNEKPEVFGEAYEFGKNGGKRELGEISWVELPLLNLMKVSVAYSKLLVWRFDWRCGVEVVLFSYPTNALLISTGSVSWHSRSYLELTIWRSHLNIVSKSLLMSFKIMDLPIIIINLTAPKCQKQTSVGSVFIKVSNPKNEHVSPGMIFWYSSSHHHKNLFKSHSAKKKATIWCKYPYHSHLLAISKFQNFQACFLKHLGNEKKN